MYMLYQRSFPTPLFDSGSEKKKTVSYNKVCRKSANKENKLLILIFTNGLSNISKCVLNPISYTPKILMKKALMGGL